MSSVSTRQPAGDTNLAPSVFIARVSSLSSVRLNVSYT